MWEGTLCELDVELVALIRLFVRYPPALPGGDLGDYVVLFDSQLRSSGLWLAVIVPLAIPGSRQSDRSSSAYI